MKEFIEKLIGRLEEVAIETLGISKGQFSMDEGEYSSYCSLSLFDVEEQANQLAEEYNNGWIPCSERLPKLEEDVLLSLRNLKVCRGFLANTGGCFYCEGQYIWYDNAIAWQPLPEPYQEKGEHDNEC